MTSVGDRLGCVTVLEVIAPEHKRWKWGGTEAIVRCDCLLEKQVRVRMFRKRGDQTRCGHKCELGKASADVPERVRWTHCRNPLCERKLRRDNTTGFCTGCMRGEVDGGRRWYRLSHPQEWLIKQRERMRTARAEKALRGECSWCSTPAIDGEALCARCKANERESRRACRKSRIASSAAWRARQIAAGLCVLCAESAAPERRRCARHLAEDSAKKLARYQARKLVDEATREAA